MGFQHALAMIGGLITVPYLIGFNAYNVSSMLASPAGQASWQQPPPAQ